MPVIGITLASGIITLALGLCQLHPREPLALLGEFLTKHFVCTLKTQDLRLKTQVSILK